MSRGPDAGTLLQRAIERDARNAGCRIAVSDARMTRWASATFVGARHAMMLTACDEAPLADWLTGLAEADLPLRGHLVADVTVLAITRQGDTVQVALEALTVEV